MVGLGVARKLALLDFLFIAAKRLQRIRLKVGVGFHKLRHELIEKTKEIVEHKNLAVAVGTGSDSNGRNSQLFRDGLSQLGRDGFEHDGESAGCFESLGIVQQGPRMIRFFSLHFVAAISMDRLGSHAEMPHDRDADTSHLSHTICHHRATFQLDGLSPGL